MEYLTVKEIAEKWGISERRLQTMCKEGMVEGSKRFGRNINGEKYSRHRI